MCAEDGAGVTAITPTGYGSYVAALLEIRASIAGEQEAATSYETGAPSMNFTGGDA